MEIFSALMNARSPLTAPACVDSIGVLRRRNSLELDHDIQGGVPVVCSQVRARFDWAKPAGLFSLDEDTHRVRRALTTPQNTGPPQDTEALVRG